MIHQATVDYSPYDVVAWCGRYYPTKYNLLHFMAFTSGTWDHADPSLHTVLNCPLDARLGSSALDFVCFRGRWDVAENTFRPPYYHRNVASEFSAILKLESEYSGFQQGMLCVYLSNYISRVFYRTSSIVNYISPSYISSLSMLYMK